MPHRPQRPRPCAPGWAFATATCWRRWRGASTPGRGRTCSSRPWPAWPRRPAARRCTWPSWATCSPARRRCASACTRRWRRRAWARTCTSCPSWPTSGRSGAPATSPWCRPPNPSPSAWWPSRPWPAACPWWRRHTAGCSTSWSPRPPGCCSRRDRPWRWPTRWRGWPPTPPCASAWAPRARRARRGTSRWRRRWRRRARPGWR